MHSTYDMSYVLIGLEYIRYHNTTKLLIFIIHLKYKITWYSQNEFSFCCTQETCFEPPEAKLSFSNDGIKVVK